MSLHCPTTRRKITLATAAAVLAALLLALAPGALAQANGRTLLGPTPLILKDGRIAKVSVHVFPFPQGASELAARPATELATLTHGVATDCFLTAQVIGHVGPEEAGASDTLGAHRLARARADAIQASLIGGGLPAKAIASVWDWQFMVREPRATLWLFRLVEGEDCDGQPLDPDAAPPVARADPPQRVARSSNAAEPPAQRREAVPAGPAPQDGGAPEETRRVPAASVDRAPEQTKPAATTAAAAPEPTPPAREPAKPAKAPAAKAPAAGETEAKPAETRPAARQPDAASAESIAITFANNSSYFPPGTQQELEGLVDRLSSGGRYRVQVDVGVSDSTQVVGAKSAEEAARYNAWLAERRRDRVLEWLEERIDTSEVEIDSTFKENDNSRQVRIRLTPIRS